MQQQQHADYDLLAVFSDEAKAEAAIAKLHKEGFSEEEVHHLTAGSAGQGQFREHGPNSARREYFLRTQQSGPNPVLIILFAIIAGIVLGVLTFAASLAIPALPEPTTRIIGAVVGIAIGVLIGLLRRGRTRGDIGQGQPQPQAQPAVEGERTIVALRFDNHDNISRKSRARAILLNNQGRIDRSVGRRDD